MYVIEGSKRLYYIRFVCKDEEEKEINVDVKQDNVITIEVEGGKQYTGKVKSISENNFKIDCSAKYNSEVVTVDYASVNKVQVE